MINCHTIMSSQKWLSELKCLPTAKSILLVVMDDLWLLTLMLSLSHVLITAHATGDKIHHIFGFAAECLEYFVLVLCVGAL